MGVHAVRPPPPPPSGARRRIRLINHRNGLVYFVLIITVLFPSFGAAQRSNEEIAKERDALIKFKSSLLNADPALSDWKSSDGDEPGSSIPCGSDGEENWAGLLCFEGNVWGLQLENMNLSGEIDIDSLLGLPQLRTLSFMHNLFDGPLPEFRKLGALKSLFVSYNRFSGPIPGDAFLGMPYLKKVYMSHNMFTGPAPDSLSAPRLLELRIDSNQFVGTLPDFPPTVKVFNVSNNQLEGPIPPSLQDIDPTCFAGNKGLCGPPLKTDCSNRDPQPASSTDKQSTLRTVVYVICAIIALAAVVALYVAYHRRNGNGGSRQTQTAKLGRPTVNDNSNNKNLPGGIPQTQVGIRSLSQSQLSRGNSRKSVSSGVVGGGGSGRGGGGDNQHGKLSFVRDDRTRFDLQDLLRASAEVLGSGSFGSSYKAVLMDGQAVVVKRFKQMNNCGKEEFHEHMRRLGRLAHPNLLPLVAYYYRKEEKLLVFDFVQNGSLARQLHGNHSVDKPGLDWPTRLKIIKGVARGLAYLYSELPSLIVPHGHLKSSNVLLDRSMEPLLMDYTLVPVVNLEQAQHLMVAYKAPEYTRHGRTTKKSDVWSLGILILETLTGKFPANYLAQGHAGYGADLVSWVDGIAKEAESSEDRTQVFDKEMRNVENAQEQMHKLLKIGMGCCQVDLEKRQELKEAVDMIASLKERDDQ